MKQGKQYAKLDLTSPLLANYKMLNEGHRKEMRDVANAFMSKYEIVRCPDCLEADEYNPESKVCNACWYGVLDDICRETIETEGWNDAE